MKHKINVDEKDIKKGTPNDCNLCAVSQALKRKFKTDKTSVDIDVNGDVCMWVKNKEYEVSDMHESDVADFIYDFDQEDGWSKVKPMTFEIIERSA
jgi:hypothetical protein